MRRNGYGWLGLEASHSQQAGFFIDDENKILFWPNNKQGYQLPEEDAYAYLRRYAIHNPFSFITFALYIPLALIVSFLAQPFSLGFLIAITVATLIIRLALYIFNLVLIRRNEHQKMASKYSPTSIPRPKAEIIKPSLKYIAFLSIGSLLLGCFMGLTAWTVIPDRKYVIFILLAAITIFILFDLFHSIWTYFKGVSIENIRFFKPSPWALSTHYYQIKIEQEKKHFSSYLKFEISLIKKYWIFFVIGLLLLRIPFYYDHYSNTYLSAENVTHAYQKHVVEELNIFKPAHVYKWDKEIDIFVDEAPRGKLKEELVETFIQNAEKVGIQLNFHDNHENETDIIITFDDAGAPNDYDHSTVFSYTFDSLNGNITRFKIHAFPVSWEKSHAADLEIDKSLRTYQISNIFYALLSFNTPTVPHDIIFYDSRLNAIELRLLLAAIHYDDRIKAGMKAEELREVIKIIATEIEEAPSFMHWAKETRIRKMPPDKPKS